MFIVNISIEDNKVLSQFIADSYFFDPKKYEYAFYLYKDGEKIDSKGYSNSSKITFDLNDALGCFHVKAFIKDIEIGNKRSYTSDKIFVK